MATKRPITPFTSVIIVRLASPALFAGACRPGPSACPAATPFASVQPGRPATKTLPKPRQTRLWNGPPTRTVGRRDPDQRPVDIASLATLPAVDSAGPRRRKTSHHEPRKPQRRLDVDALDEWAAELCGKTLNGRYRIDEAIGFGMTGGVFKGHHLSLSKTVAIKILHEELRCNPNIRARFEREALTASRLSHRNCIEIADVDEDGDISYFVMPLVEGFELSEMMGLPLEEDAAISIVRQLLEALDHAHQQGIVHRDVKPENVLVIPRVREPSLVKLLDFGIAKVTLPSDHKRLTTVGQVFGTPQYMSPEQARGADVTEQSDLYSTGLILYELLRGKPAFESDEPLELVKMQISDPVPPLPRRIPRRLSSVLERLVAKEPENRFSTAVEVLAALEGVHGAPEAPSVGTSKSMVSGTIRPTRPSSIPTQPALSPSTVSAISKTEIPAPRPRLRRLVDAPALPLSPAVDTQAAALVPPRSGSTKIVVAVAVSMVLWISLALLLFTRLGA